MESINLALEYGYNPVKVNCVVMRGVNDDEILDFVEWTRARNAQVRFIEYMPFGGNKWTDKKFLSYTEMLGRINTKYPTISRLKDNSGADTAKEWKIPGFIGSVGFITSMSDHFCSTCNRLRITADGNLKVCLFGDAEISLRDAMRKGCTDEDLASLIESAVKGKKEHHGGLFDMYDIANSKNRPMILIGG